MAQRVSAGLSVAEARKFGLVVGTAFGVLGAIMWWRGHETGLYVVAVPAVFLITFGLVAPTVLRPVHRWWMAFALALSKVTTPIFMGIVYFAVLMPIGLIRRTLGHNPIVNAAHGSSYWAPREPSNRRSDLRRQF